MPLSQAFFTAPKKNSRTKKIMSKLKDWANFGVIYCENLVLVHIDSNNLKYSLKVFGNQKHSDGVQSCTKNKLHKPKSSHCARTV